MADVILDESNGHLFDRDDLVKEEKAACHTKIQNVILQQQQNDGYNNNEHVLGLKRPILVITCDSRRALQTRIMAFLPDELTNNNVWVYFFDPLTGDRDAEAQTERGLFVRYLQEG